MRSDIDRVFSNSLNEDNNDVVKRTFIDTFAIIFKQLRLYSVYWMIVWLCIVTFPWQRCFPVSPVQIIPSANRPIACKAVVSFVELFNYWTSYRIRHLPVRYAPPTKDSLSLYKHCIIIGWLTVALHPLPFPVIRSLAVRSKRTHTRTYTHTHIYTHTHAHTNTHKCTHLLAFNFTHAHTYIHAYTKTLTHSNSQLLCTLRSTTEVKAMRPIRPLLNLSFSLSSPLSLHPIPFLLYMLCSLAFVNPPIHSFSQSFDLPPIQICHPIPTPSIIIIAAAETTSKAAHVNSHGHLIGRGHWTKVVGRSLQRRRHVPRGHIPIDGIEDTFL